MRPAKPTASAGRSSALPSLCSCCCRSSAESAYYQLVLTQVLLWAVLSLAWNMLCGYSGYFSFGHAAFWGLGAYTVALGMLYFDLTPWLTIPFCAVVGAARRRA